MHQQQNDQPWLSVFIFYSVAHASVEERQAMHSFAHPNSREQHSSGSAKQSWQPASPYLHPFAINTMKQRAESHHTLAK